MGGYTGIACFDMQSGYMVSMSWQTGLRSESLADSDITSNVRKKSDPTSIGLVFSNLPTKMFGHTGTASLGSSCLFGLCFHLSWMKKEQKSCRKNGWCGSERVNGVVGGGSYCSLRLNVRSFFGKYISKNTYFRQENTEKALS